MDIIYIIKNIQLKQILNCLSSVVLVLDKFMLWFGIGNINTVLVIKYKTRTEAKKFIQDTINAGNLVLTERL